MEGTIANFRMSRHVQKGNHMIVVVDGVSDLEKAKALVGKKVVWKSPAEKEINGKVANVHGRKGAVRVIFDSGMPGQAIGTKVSIS